MAAMRATLLCLHGWGGSSASFDALKKALGGSNIEVLAPDLPGFGAEPEPTRPWHTVDYAQWVVDWLAKNHKDTGPLLLLGHSHGGRIALLLCAGEALKPTHLFLCAPAINRHGRYRLRRQIGYVLAKGGKAILSLPGLSLLLPAGRRLLYKLMRVHDYERASPLMQQTLVLVTRDDITPLAMHIAIPTELFWGEDDRQTPIADGEFLAETMPHARLHRFAGVRHAVHRDRAAEIAAAVRKAAGI